LEENGLQSNHVLSVHWRLITFAIVTAVIFSILFILRTVLLPYFIGLILAYIFRPAVVFLEKRFPVSPEYRRLRRVIVILVIFVAAAAVVALISVLFITTLVNSGQDLLNNAASIFQSATDTVKSWLASIRENVPDSFRSDIDNLLANAGTSISSAIQAAVSRTVSFIPSATGFLIGLIVLPIFLFYLMLDWDRLAALLAKGNSVWKIYARDIVTIVGRVMGRYIRGQIVLGAIVGGIIFVGMKLIGFNTGIAIALGFVSFVMEMVPVFGPWITLIIGVVVTLAFLPQKIIWMIGLHAMIPVLEGNYLVPRIQGQALNIHPVLGLLVLVLGANLAGVWGLVIAFPFTATVIALFNYFVASARTEDHLEPAGQTNPVVT
jgi:predicted PurR-regulated permease PerM